MSVFMLRQMAQADPTGTMDEHLDAVEAEIDVLEARVAELTNALDNLAVHATHLEPCPGWVCIPQVEWDAALAAEGKGET